ncbi:hypothetical protein Bpfe_019373 [Biomphalaria pfeifferi]|uniref:Uncharacterized protein n=1 Tax=Biomphalaria pfeifferi TaxID=112525 RepID=A0AAD8BD64_BIOPF|nr:hypothetical protein Bpfe_019373 [Biomphalaria pfeifferi]
MLAPNWLADDDAHALSRASQHESVLAASSRIFQFVYTVVNRTAHNSGTGKKVKPLFLEFSPHPYFVILEALRAEPAGEGLTSAGGGASGQENGRELLQAGDIST